MKCKLFFAVFIIASLITGCSGGIQSNKPILNKGNSNAIYDISGYWAIESISGIDKNGKLETAPWNKDSQVGCARCFAHQTTQH